MAFVLPPEIWSTIIDFLPRGDQLRVCQVSLRLCALARRAIYCEVELSSRAPNSRATLTLLANDHSLARSVERLHIHTAGEPVHEAWVDPVVLAGMTRLRNLKLIMNPFYTISDQEGINNSIEALRSLKKFEFRNTSSEDPERIFSYGPVLRVKGLEEIIWVDSGASWPLPIFPLLITSCSTLVRLHLPDLSSYDATASSHTEFFSLRFPHLSTLHYGGWRNEFPMGSMDKDFTTFLLAHPLISDLHLGFYNTYKDTICSISHDVTLEPRAFPNLRYLKIDTANFFLLARAGVLSLKALDSLHIGWDEESEEGGFAEICTALESLGGLPGVRLLKLELYGLVSDAESAHWVEGFGRLCPRVQRFWGDLTVGATAVNNHDVFASYINLKLLVLPDIGLGGLPDRARIDGVREFAACNPSVIDLQFYLSDTTGAVTFRFVIERDTKGEITSITEEVGGVPAHVERLTELSCECEGP